MSQEAVDTVRRAYEAWNTGDFNAASEFLDPEIVWRMPPNVPEAGTYRGSDEVKYRLADFLESWEQFQVEVVELIDAGDRVVALARFKGRSKGVGLTLTGGGVDAQVWTVRDGRATEVRMYSGTEEALKATGLSGRAPRDQGT